jgi:multiple antibiotic resistance protein
MGIIEYTLLAASSLFVIVDPIAVVPTFLAMTPTDSFSSREQMARFAAGTMAGILLLFGFLGQPIFKLLGITLPAFSIAGSIVLLIIALDMLQAQRSRVQETEEETFAGAAKPDIAITPLAMPMLAGPGAISTTILLNGQASTFAHHLALVGCILAVSFVTYIILRFAARSSQWLSPIAMKLTTRVMGLILASVAIQFMVNALRDLGVIPKM